MGTGLVRVRNAQRLQLLVELGQCAGELLLPGGVRGRGELPAQLGVSEPQRFGAANTFRIVIRFLIGASCALFLAFVHPLLDAVLGVD